MKIKRNFSLIDFFTSVGCYLSSETLKDNIIPLLMKSDGTNYDFKKQIIEKLPNSNVHLNYRFLAIRAKYDSRGKKINFSS